MVTSNLATEWKSKEGSRSSGCNEAGTDPDLCLGKGDHGHEGDQSDQDSASSIITMRMMMMVRVVMLVIYLAHQIVFGKSILIPDLECKYKEHKHISPP